MIDESLLKSNFTGRDGFTWWIGRVANHKFWKQTDEIMTQSGAKGHRVKVRIIGYHPWNTEELPENDLPWAEVLNSPNVGSGQLSRGETMNLVGGETAVGFFMDGEEAQQPVIFGLLHRQGNVPDSIKPQEAAVGKTGFEVHTGVELQKATDRISPTLAQISEDNPAGSILKTASEITGDAEKADVNKTPTTEFDPRKISAAAAAFEKMTTEEVTSSGTCGDTSIGQITQVLTDFIALTNSVEKTINGFVDPVLNEVVDMTYQAKKAAKRVMGIIKMVMNQIRDGLISKLSLLFSTFLGGINTFNPAEFITTPIAQKGFMKVLALLFCIFEKLLDSLLSFLQNLFDSLIGSLINGPICAVEQFTSAILSKVMDALEKGLEPILEGLDWLMGGVGKVKDVLAQVSSLATQILSFIGCDGLKCTTPSKWISTMNGSIELAADDWQKQVSNINVFKQANTELTRIERDAQAGITDLFANDGVGENGYKSKNYRGQDLDKILKRVDKLTGGKSSKLFNKGLDSIEAAIATSSLFGEDNELFNACNNRRKNPQDQGDIIPMPMGWVYGTCIPPKAKILSDSGRGAELRTIVGNRGEIFSVEVISGGRNYLQKETSLVIVDNSNHGSGASVIPKIVDGKIQSVIVKKGGRGYCPNTPGADTGPTTGPFPDPTYGIPCDTTNDCPEGYVCVDGQCLPGLPCDVTADCPDGYQCVNGRCVPIVPTGIGTNIVGVVTSIEPVGPGIGYSGGEDVFIGEVPCPQCIVGVSTINGSVTGIDLNGFNVEFTFQPQVSIYSDTGIGAELITIMKYKEQFTTDTNAGPRRRLVGITSVVDCIGIDTPLIGYVNGEPYYGPYHVHPETGVKMVGDRHVSTPHDIIYDTVEESLGGNVIISSTSEPESETTTQTESINTAPTTVQPTPVVDTTPTPTTTPAPTPTPTPTPTDTPINTNTNTNTNTGNNQGGGSYGY